MDAQPSDPLLLFTNKQTISYDKTVTQALQTISIAKGEVEYCFVVADDMCNLGGNLHGGAIATLIDMVTSFALITHGLFYSVSVSLNVSYLAAAPKGSTVHIRGLVTKIGKTLCFTESTLFMRKADGQKVVLATGLHTKFIIHSSL